MDFSQIAVLMVSAAFFGIIARSLKQPLLVGYLSAGIFLASTGILTENFALTSLGEIGVALLLFLLGLEIDIQELGIFSKSAFILGLGQMAFTAIVSFILVKILGFSTIASVYFGLGLSFSSTIIVVKLLSEKKDLASLYGRLTVSILVIQDMVAILTLMFLSGVAEGHVSLQQIFTIGVEGVLLIGGMWFISKKILPSIFEKFITYSNELTFIAGIAWALGVSSFVKERLGFGLEIGGFLAGLSLSNLPEHLQIASRTRSLRDFFLTIFFLLLGARLTSGTNIISVLPAALILSAFVLIGKTVIILVILGFSGYKKRTSFLTGISLAQVSEFSLILIAAGGALGQISTEEVTISVLVGVITMVTSTYLITASNWLYKKVHPYLRLFERRKTIEEPYAEMSDLKDHIVLVGCDRTGRSLLPFFLKKGLPFLVVDFNPKVFTTLTADKIPVIFGDINDQEILQAAKIESARLVVSTVGDLADSLTLLEYIRKLENPPKTIFTSSLRSDALKLYEKGADYVILPEMVAGDHIKQLLRIYGTRSERLKIAGKSHFNRLMFM